MRCLKTVLWICALGCFTAVPFALLPWDAIDMIMGIFALDPLPETAAVKYLIRVSCGVYGLIGIYFIILAGNPLDYGPMLNLGAYGLIFFGLLSLIIGFNLGVPVVIFGGDAFFGLFFGIVTAVISSRAKSTGRKAS